MNDCCICLEYLNITNIIIQVINTNIYIIIDIYDDNIKKLPCNHLIHYNCYTNLLKYKIIRCPLCKEYFKKPQNELNIHNLLNTNHSNVYLGFNTNIGTCILFILLCGIFYIVFIFTYLIPNGYT